MEYLVGDTYGLIHLMYWSVVGLYAVFAAGVLTRIPETPFFGMVGIATGTITIIGGIFIRINKAKWVKIFKMKNEMLT